MNETLNSEKLKIKELIESIKSNPNEHLHNYKIVRLQAYLNSFENK